MHQISAKCVTFGWPFDPIIASLSLFDLVDIKMWSNLHIIYQIHPHWKRVKGCHSALNDTVSVTKAFLQKLVTFEWPIDQVKASLSLFYLVEFDKWYHLHIIYQIHRHWKRVKGCHSASNDAVSVTKPFFQKRVILEWPIDLVIASLSLFDLVEFDKWSHLHIIYQFHPHWKRVKGRRVAWNVSLTQ